MREQHQLFSEISQCRLNHLEPNNGSIRLSFLDHFLPGSSWLLTFDRIAVSPGRVRWSIPSGARRERMVAAPVLQLDRRTRQASTSAGPDLVAYAHPSSFTASPECQIFVMCRIWLSSNSITYT